MRTFVARDFVGGLDEPVSDEDMHHLCTVVVRGKIAKYSEGSLWGPARDAIFEAAFQSNGIDALRTAMPDRALRRVWIQVVERCSGRDRPELRSTVRNGST